jgi:predicted Rossmann fold flavoprotein
LEREPSDRTADVAIVGAGAAGLAAAIFARRDRPAARVVVFDGARKPGAKILVSGGSRCNVTNETVTERDFNGGSPAFVRRVLKAFTVAETIAFFRELGVPLHAEDGGKLFPDSNRSRDVLDALLRATADAGATLQAGRRVLDVARAGNGFRLETTAGPCVAGAVILATGGLSLPKTGSDGAGYGFARALGHAVVPTTPALVPLLLDEPQRSFAASLSGVALNVELSVLRGGQRAARAAGSLLWTHFGVSGPAALDASRHWLRVALEQDGAPGLAASFCPRRAFDDVDREWTRLAMERPRSRVDTVLGSFVPSSMAGALLRALGVDDGMTLARLPREERRRLAHALTAWPLAVGGSRGYGYAEVTAGGVALDGVEAATLRSRACPGLFLVGEILDVDGRIGGFNFQWAWSTARVAARAVARWLADGR